MSGQRADLRIAGSSRSTVDASRLLRDAGPTMSIREAAAVLGCCAATVRAMHARGELADMGIKVLRLGSNLRVATASLRRAVAVDADTPGGAA